MPGVFVSYRRDDARDAAGRLEDALRLRFGRDNVFRDTSSIPAGVRWEDRLHDELASAQVVLALIGDRWIDARSDSGTRRLDDPDDHVRREIEHGLASTRVRVVPVLLEGVRIPKAEQLPGRLAELVDLQGYPLADASWERDVDRLLASLEEDVWRQPRLKEWGARGKKRARNVASEGQRVADTLRSVRTFDTADVDLAELARLLRAFYEQDKLEAQVIDVPKGVMVQAKTRGLRAVGGMGVALTVCLSKDNDKLLVEIGPGQWGGKAVAAAVSPWIPPLLLTAGYGAMKQRALPKKTYRFISSYLDGLVPRSS